MSPPRPPSPPLGPPRGTYFSRRNARQPLPPSPAFTRILTSSINIGEKGLGVRDWGLKDWSLQARDSLESRAPSPQPLALDPFFDADELAAASAIAENH